MTFEVIVRKKVIKKINKISPYRDKIIVALSSLESNAFLAQFQNPVISTIILDSRFTLINADATLNQRKSA